MTKRDDLEVAVDAFLAVVNGRSKHDRRDMRKLAEALSDREPGILLDFSHALKGVHEDAAKKQERQLKLAGAQKHQIWFRELQAITGNASEIVVFHEIRRQRFSKVRTSVSAFCGGEYHLYPGRCEILRETIEELPVQADRCVHCVQGKLLRAAIEERGTVELGREDHPGEEEGRPLLSFGQLVHEELAAELVEMQPLDETEQALWNAFGPGQAPRLYIDPDDAFDAHLGITPPAKPDGEK